MVLRLVHPAKALVPMVGEPRIVRVVRLVQFWNAPLPMLVMLSGSEVNARLVHISNAFAPILVNPEGRLVRLRL